ncbi:MULTISPECIES: MmcQ/YjbR family DNA-binding protein [unclassified Breznakia]|uniref:MmcQ/YjbR family DNA-binding protein n=1 Tax=unclassified Breznakia TaxID=2623764 RepID=UPI002472F813|nr:MULTISPECIES: MmcQ/YjbR family DNA-binding protein [unclassified Breznakia]MDH6366106.1 putative DNA-binding protein (MmcQ/YjbR family) [Breznakia sp. PH1-1]MDH6402962.1 putative DNA-binding protein (MmcQ/YjbR family) [Breznakia sp. PF1-11]MDH6410671.1 putative DNA-binding protein (MmcQ/YjbR family) [Breznakia sp. PFB1-11]MDH6413272.1 putative DNA-binding protein (MmcQ/YjbR family) [Breznakia sp. PFB1-14]MDH6415640.1 putative DNA-binding protein (MmcQ/YjbR family) [Breznakia sp. PFB1-4]
MKRVDYIFENEQVNFDTLEPYGFVQSNSRFVYTTKIVNEQFIMEVEIDIEGHVQTKLIDVDTHEPYHLHEANIEGGAFIATVRSEYEAVLIAIKEACFEQGIFHSQQAQDILHYVREMYHAELEFLWEKFSDNAILRRADSNKWFGTMMRISKQKLGLADTKKVEIIGLRAKPEELEHLIDYKRYHIGYHMNKKHWYTIILDDSVSIEEIKRRIDISYELAL